MNSVIIESGTIKERSTTIPLNTHSMNYFNPILLGCWPFLRTPTTPILINQMSCLPLGFRTRGNHLLISESSPTLEISQEPPEEDSKRTIPLIISSHPVVCVLLQNYNGIRQSVAGINEEAGRSVREASHECLNSKWNAHNSRSYANDSDPEMFRGVDEQQRRGTKLFLFLFMCLVSRSSSSNSASTCVP